ITAAVSGGADSMALLTVLKELASPLELSLSAAHLNHLIRPEARQEAALVSDYCRQLEIPLHSGSSDVPAEAKRSGTGLEEAARELRYSFLREAAARLGADSVALGHNMNDQAETVLAHIIRGSGISGLSGMPARRDIFIRPILCCSRLEIENYIEKNNIPFAVDSSNFDTSYLRNRIRNSLLPELAKEYNPSIIASLSRLSENLSELIGPLSGRIDQVLDSAIEDSGVNIPIETVEKLSDFQIYLLTDRMLCRFFDLHQDILKCHFDAVKSLVRESDSGKEVILPHGIKVSREQLFLRFSATAGDEESRLPPYRIACEGEYIIPGWGLKAQISQIDASQAGSMASSEREAYLADLKFPLVIRAREAGDRIRPFGMKGTKKLSDLMIDCKVPLHRREKIPVISDAGGIAWVPGLATSERTRVTEKSSRITRIRLVDERAE
ncbi:MAG: tRNA lysidine(34) synthetase TilS, partial [Candidatus Latescibacteria bacterium]|nr:tRNA lysidine(34) synthetase TilS [bacterium]MBD3423009.1 tRNA lysidine(34) synthetase TilS [Candidatus Latescibacterota bacterium]